MTTPVAPPERPPLVKRTTLIVRSIERARAFYRDVMGFKVWYDRDFEFSGGGFPGTTKGQRCRLVILEARDPLIGKIGLIEYLDVVVPAPPVDLSFLGPGRLVFVGEIDSVSALHERLQRWGATIATPPHRFDVVGADGRAKHMQRICFFDPDGNFMEFSEPAQAD
jgi:catechol 2,3-dioxygenase-like lactoylglutathione lyase family enzyme